MSLALVNTGSINEHFESVQQELLAAERFDFEKLGLEGPFPENSRYFDHGEVESVPFFRNKIYVFGYGFEPTHEEGEHLRRGEALIIEALNGETHHHVYHSNSRVLRSKVAADFIGGHEETHAIHGMGLLPKLENELLKLGRNLKLRAMLDMGVSKEVVAEIGGLYSLERIGAVPSLVYKLMRKYGNPNLERAFKFYSESKIGKIGAFLERRRRFKKVA